ncbi:LOW QUALITY PROTEIN: tetratricopeptide repeat protein 17 [Hyla sarda]|uniref:LOW QUALITY PROTEIN: tetratricopeptide repeat protein 17 n=1 Tax=Hyla sarda TaxID=327740 RepID=UPI0024C22D11|nr:LOW QUALITY PROTEIN: tetratricopeptide repeat protein 17 [Hyla sarda]
MTAGKMAESRSGPQYSSETGAPAAAVWIPQGWACLLGVFSLLWTVGPSGATTHWVVTEDGKIQQQVDSPMNLKHPHDLVILMRQETTVGYLKDLEKHLVAQKIHIEENEDRDTGLEQRHYKDDPDCVLAKVPLGDMDLYDGTYMPLEDKNINPEDDVDIHSHLPPDLQQPDCTRIIELPFSIHAFQHLRGIQERKNLSAPLLPKEDPIFSSLSQKLGKNVDDIGHRIHEALVKNTTSWVLYNMASFYWRIKNEPFHVVECAMRALHFSSRHNKDIALLNMANVLHRAHFSADAAILVHAALDVSPGLDVSTDSLVSHYTLGNIYAMLGEYNHSVLCYDRVLESRPFFYEADKRKKAVLCQQKLEQKLEAQHRSLQRTLNELKEYQKQHDHYLRQQEVLEKHKLIQEEQILRNIIHETQMAKEAQLGNHQICQITSRKHSLHCPWDLPVRYHRGDIFENVEHVLFGDDTSSAQMTSVNLDLQANQTVLLQRPPVSRSVTKVWGLDAASLHQDTDDLWPKKTDCATRFPMVPPPEELPKYYLPPGQPGLSVSPAVLKQIDTGSDLHTPDCASVPEMRKNETLQRLLMEVEGRLDMQQLKPDRHAQQALQSLVDNLSVTEDELKLSLYLSFAQPAGPVWTILNEAALYWRAIGNCTQAIACLRRALNQAPAQNQHIPLVNLANLLMHHGLYLDASKLLLQARTLDRSEPLTLLSLGNAYLSLKNLSGALHVFRAALDLNRGCSECRDSLPLIRCLQLYPLLYNASSPSVCSGHCPAEDKEQNTQKYFHSYTQEEHKTPPEDRTDPTSGSTLYLESKRLPGEDARDVIMAETNNSEDTTPEAPISEEMLALVDEFENSWPLEAFEGALELKGRRMDLQGIRVLKKGVQDGQSGSCYGDCDDDEEAEWITFQVKRVKKPKADGSGGADLSEAIGGDVIDADNDDFQAALEISGPKIPSPGPQGRRPDYRSLGWPSPDECLKLRRVELSTVASTWLAVSAKNIDITEHVDFGTQLQEPGVEPLCNANLPASMHTLDHLYGVANRAAIHYTGESQLKEVLQNLGKDKYPPQSLEQVGTRIMKVLEKNQTSWVLSSMAALYWRVKGQGKKAIDCLRQALHYAPHHMKDVPLISLANIFHNAKLWNDAIIVATMAVEIAPHFVVNHFTLANVYVAMEEYEKAMRWYESTLGLQPEFAPAKDRIRAIQCHLLMKKGRRSP